MCESGFSGSYSGSARRASFQSSQRAECSIMRADTGSGKTFVAVLLIRSVLARPTTPDRKQLVVFTTPTTTLVTQQAHVIATQTTARVKAFLGAEVDFWKRERFEEELANADVLVCVPQIWLNILNSGSVCFFTARSDLHTED